MDAIYRWQTGIYDLTRKYYLLGRDRMLLDLAPPRGAEILEIGCGTGRNLLKAARLHPTVKLFGIDVSTVMLETAGATIERGGERDRIRIALADATAFNSVRTFGRSGFDRVFFSYTLSMIPPWRDALPIALDCVAPGGELHIVDFGPFQRLPSGFKRLVYGWLRLFHVEPRADLVAVLRPLVEQRGATLRVAYPFRGYVEQIVVTMPGEH